MHSAAQRMRTLSLTVHQGGDRVYISGLELAALTQLDHLHLVGCHEGIGDADGAAPPAAAQDPLPLPDPAHRHGVRAFAHLMRLTYLAFGRHERNSEWSHSLVRALAVAIAPLTRLRMLHLCGANDVDEMEGALPVTPSFAWARLPALRELRCRLNVNAGANAPLIPAGTQLPAAPLSSLECLEVCAVTFPRGEEVPATIDSGWLLQPLAALTTLQSLRIHTCGRCDLCGAFLKGVLMLTQLRELCLEDLKVSEHEGALGQLPAHLHALTLLHLFR